MQKDELTAHLICPDCKSKVLLKGQRTLTCIGCKRSFSWEDDVILMLPSKIGRNFEDAAWKTLPYEGIERPDWMALLHKKDRILYFYERILPKVDFSGRVLEIGAGTCWASALIKKKHSEGVAVASDISPYALEKGCRVESLLDSSVDYHIACGAEHLPFSNEYFDV